jgi:hypothetical protein
LVNNIIKTRALWFINQEIERILKDLESGTINKDQAIGSLNTIFNIASGIEHVKFMQKICRLIGYIRSTDYFFQIRKLYLKNYSDESQNVTGDKDII